MVAVPLLQDEEAIERWADLIEASGGSDMEVANRMMQAVREIPFSDFFKGNFYAISSSHQAIPVGFERFNVPIPYTLRALSLLALQPLDRVLLLGAGSGYTMALLCALRAGIFCVEPVGLLAQRVRQKLDRLHYQNAIVRVGGVENGWSDYAPYEAMLIEDVVTGISPKLTEQLAEGARIVALIGDREQQRLTLFEKNDGELDRFEMEDWSIFSRDGY